MAATQIDSSRPNVTVTNTATETPVYTVTIPANTLGTAGLVYALLLGKKVKNGGGVDTAMEVHVYWGGTQILALHPTNVDSDNANGVSLVAEVWIAALGATGSQSLRLRLTGGTNGFGDPGFVKEVYGTATKDSTIAQTLEFRWVQAATPAHSYTSEHGVVLAL